MTSNNFSIIFVNKSNNAGSATIYQNDPSLGVSGAHSLAWFSKFANPDTSAFFDWTVDYSFTWADTGVLAPGVIYRSAQTLPADLTTSNQTTLTFNGGFQFINQGAGPIAGSLQVLQDNTIPPRQGAVGIGLGERPVYAVQAQPNISLTFNPKPQYFLTFGNFLEGEVLDLASITNAVALDFPSRTFSLTVTLNPDNTFTVKPTSEANAQLLAAREDDPEAQFGTRLAA